MEIIFLYNRLYCMSRQQIEALCDENYDLLERLTEEREELTGRICRMLESGDFDLEKDYVSKKATELTEKILEIDEELKNALLEELFQRTLTLSSLRLVEE